MNVTTLQLERARDIERNRLSSKLKMAESDSEAVALNHKLRLIQAIEDIFKMMDDGILVRDISRDHDSDFYQRNLDFVLRLAKIKQAVDQAKGHQ